MGGKADKVVEAVVAALKSQLGDNLYSCSLYGSIVRGNAGPHSDINLLILLNNSTAAAHELIATVLADFKQVDPFILGRPGFERSVRCFAAKFASIRRNYRVVHGADPFATIKIDEATERFLCEQALRNLRLRMIQAFVTRRRHKNYGTFVMRSVTPLIVHGSQALRLAGITIPNDPAARTAILEREFQLPIGVVRELLEIKTEDGSLSETEAVKWHGRLIPVLDAILKWVEAKWPASS